MTVLVRGVQFGGKEVGDSVQEKGNPLLVADEPHASGRIDALSVCLPAIPVQGSHVAQEDESRLDPPSRSSAVPAPTALQATSGAAESVPLAVVLTICAWCQKVIADGPLNREGRASHGICARCSEEQMARIRQMERR